MWGVEPADLPEWERQLAAERHLQALVPGAVLVGGTAAALHAGHPRSLDGDHVPEDLRPRFDEVLATLEAAAGWQTGRVQKPVAILGRLDGVMTGIRQLRRTRPLETEVVSGLRVPTLAEMARIKAWLLATRHTVRDYPQEIDLGTYKGLVPPWNDWDISAAGGGTGPRARDGLLGEERDEHPRARASSSWAGTAAASISRATRCWRRSSTAATSRPGASSTGSRRPT